jgi:carboxymethylenebutenolidase
MAVKTEWVTTKTPDGDMRVYVARPDGSEALPGIIVIQEIFGVNDHIQDVTRRYAEQGFVAAAPEIYHRFEQKDAPYTDVQAGFKLRQQLSDDQVMDDVNATYDILNGRSDVRKGQVGIVGFCYGGRVVYLALTRNHNLKAGAAFYGGGIAADAADAPVNATEKIQAPIHLFFGGKDQSIPAEQVSKIEAALKSNDKRYELSWYPEAPHGFCCDARPNSYHAESATDAFPKAVNFFKRILSGAKAAA